MADRSVRVLLSAIVAPYQSAMAQATASTRAFQQSTGGVTGSMKQMSVTGSKLRGAIADPFTALASPVGLAAAGLALSAKAAVDFESAWAGVTKTVEGTPEQLDALKRGIRDMAKEIPASTDEIAAVAEAAGQLGIKTPAILDFTRVMIDLGNTTNLSAQAGAEALARFANITEMSDKKFQNLGSTVVELGNKYASTEAEIVEFGLRVAGAGEIAGLTEAEILAIGTAMSSVGVEAEAGGTAVQKVLLGITEQVETGGDKLEDFARVAGMSAEEFAKAWRADPAQAFTAFVEGLGESGKGAIGILKELGLTDQRLIRSFLSLAGAGDLLNQTIETGNAAWEDNEALSAEAEKRYDTTASQIEVLVNNVKDLAISLGDVLLPVINAVLGPLAEMIGVLTDLIQLDWEGVGEALKENNDATMKFASAAGWAAIQAEREAEALVLLTAEAELADVAMMNSATAATASGDASKKAAGEVDTLGGSMEETEDAAEELSTALDDLFGVHIDVARATIRYRDALADMREAINEADGSLDIHTEKGRAVRSSILDAVDAALAHVEALVDEGMATDKAAALLNNHIAAIKGQAVAAGVGKDAVDSYVRSLNLTPKEIRTLVKLLGADEAKGKVDRLSVSLRNIQGTYEALIAVKHVEYPAGGDRPIRHAGGMAGAHGARRVGGGYRSDEFPTILQRGEVVLSRSQARSDTQGLGRGPVEITVLADSLTDARRLASFVRDVVANELQDDDTRVAAHVEMRGHAA